MEFRKVFGWFSDDKPETTEAIVYASRCGVIKVGPYRHWNKKNQGYSNRKELVKTQSHNRGKQRHEAESWKGKYKHVHIRQKAYFVHRLVALAWVPNPEGKPQVNHRNGIRHDNRAENLEWVTNLENRQHAKRFARNTPRGSMSGTAKLSESQVMEIKEALKSPRFGLKAELAKRYGVVKSTITWISNGGTWTHV